jgi:uncharacterized protein
VVRRFQNAEAFLPAESPRSYRLLPFRFMRWRDGRVFLSTDAGEWLFLSAADFSDLVSGAMRPDQAAYAELKSKHILVDGSLLVPVAATATKLRTKYSFLEGFTSLHMFVVSLRCDHSCPYCQVSRVTSDKSRFDMSAETAQAAVNWVFQSPSQHIKIEFQGGEPLLNLARIEQIVRLATDRNQAEGRNLEFVIATNLSCVTDEALQLISDYGILVSTSLDGPEWLHNANRPRPGNDSYARVVSNLDRVRQVIGSDRVAALMTTTETSLNCPAEIVDEYVRLGFTDIFIRPISPYGFAVRTKAAHQYRAETFLGFFKRCLERVFYWNSRGVPLVESYTQLLARKLITPFATTYVDLQHPAGTGISAIVYNYDGDVYASDEGRMLAEMGDFTLRLGNLHKDEYRAVMGGDYLRSLIAPSSLQIVPQCSECAFMPFCGFDSAYNLATQNDLMGHRPTSGFCAKQMGLFEYVIGLLEGPDGPEKDIVTRWAVS